MRGLKYGKETKRAFADSVGLLSQDCHVMQIVYDCHGEKGCRIISPQKFYRRATEFFTHTSVRQNEKNQNPAANKDYSKSAASAV